MLPPVEELSAEQDQAKEGEHELAPTPSCELWQRSSTDLFVFSSIRPVPTPHPPREGLVVAAVLQASANCKNGGRFWNTLTSTL